jgi:hypothetical protein
MSVTFRELPAAGLPYRLGGCQGSATGARALQPAHRWRTAASTPAPTTVSAGSVTSQSGAICAAGARSRFAMSCFLPAKTGRGAKQLSWHCTMHVWGAIQFQMTTTGNRFSCHRQPRPCDRRRCRRQTPGRGRRCGLGRRTRSPGRRTRSPGPRTRSPGRRTRSPGRRALGLGRRCWFQSTSHRRCCRRTPRMPSLRTLPRLRTQRT